LAVVYAFLNSRYAETTILQHYIKDCIVIPRIKVTVFGIAMVGILVGAVGICLVKDSAWIAFFDNVHWTSGTVGAALLATLGYRHSVTPKQRLVRAWFALAYVSYAVGQLVWDVQSYFGYSQFPSPSDCFYLWMGPCLVAGLVTEIRSYQSSRKVILLDIMALSTAALTLVLVLYLPQRGSLDVLSLSVLIAYPVSLLVVTSVTLMMIPSLRLRPTAGLLWFLACSIITACSWMRWNLLALAGMVERGNLMNVSFSMAVLIAGFATSVWQLEQSRKVYWEVRCDSFLRLLPLVNVVLAVTAVVVVTSRKITVDIEEQLSIAGALIVILLAIYRQAELLKDREQLILAQKFLGTVINTVPMRIFWKDKDCRYLGCNLAFARDAGLTEPEELIGKDDFQLNWSAQAAIYQADDRAVMMDGQSRINYEEPQTTPGGQSIWLKTSKVLLGDAVGSPMGILGVYDDITQQKENQDRLKLMARVFEETQEVIMITNAQHELIDVNESFTRVSGYRRDEVLGKNPRILKSGLYGAEFYQSMWATISSTGHWSGEVWNCKKDGELYPEWLTISTIYDDAGQICNYVGIGSDISLLKQHEKQLEHIAHYDGLTGVQNRILLADRMKQAVAQTRRDQKLLAICYLDLDGFKPINDSYGHHVGDQVLIKLAERIAHVIREGDTLARLGGDEFVILLLGQDRVEECQQSVQRLLATIAQPILIDMQRHVITASIGLTVYPVDDQDPDTLLRHADYAMYEAKQSGKNQYVQYDTVAGQYALSRQQMFEEVSRGLSEDEFELFYQPKVDMASGQLVGVEALIRWQHPQKGLLSPAQFLPMIENTVLAINIGDWVIATAVAQIDKWLQAGHTIPVSVNVGGKQLLEPAFIDKLKAKFAHYPGVPHILLELEILETTALEVERSSSVIMSVCSELGVSFALDDFGTGYSTLTYLKQLPVSTLKIDQSFVRNMLEDPGDMAIIQGVIALAKVFGRITVAEGVETDRHFQALRDMGCQIAQGYGIAKPMPEEKFLQWYLQRLTGEDQALT
jgi:diguanylate cyclase (GGDEF)-like protein/PAS domain S-box-containing protein